jgi:Rod binding domain-containing protein
MTAPASRLGPAGASPARPEGIRALKRLGKPETPEQKRLMQAAKDFEAVMLSMVFKQMQQTSGADPLGGGAANQTWRDMLADERARGMAQAGGLGLADNLYQQLAQRV